MIVLGTQPEWHAMAAHAMNAWTAAQRDELVSWLWSRPEPALRILADVIDQPAARRTEVWS